MITELREFHLLAVVIGCSFFTVNTRWLGRLSKDEHGRPTIRTYLLLTTIVSFWCALLFSTR